MDKFNKSKSLPFDFFSSNCNTYKKKYETVLDELLAESSGSTLVLKSSYLPKEEYCPIYHLLWKKNMYSHKKSRLSYRYRRSATI